MSGNICEDDFEFDDDSNDEVNEDYNDEAFAKLTADVKTITKSTRKRVAKSGSVRGYSTTSCGINFGSVTNITGKDDQHKVAAPSSKYEQKRVARKRGYAEVAEDVNKWEGIVNQQRRAEQVTFPLKDQSLSILKASRQFKPRMKTDLEKDLYELIAGSEIAEPKEETAEEKAIREAMSLEEVTERNQEAWRLRLLRDKIGKKAFLRNKTKSKKFHRIEKKYKMREEAKKLDSLEKTNPELAAKKLVELQNIRAEERMTQRHKQSKWSKQMQQRARTDKNAVEALQETDKLHREYKQKIRPEEEDEDSSTDEDDSEESNEEDAEVQDMNNEPTPGVADEGFAKMKKYWLKYNEQKDERVKKILKENKKKRKIAQMTPEDKATEEMKDIVKNKLSKPNDTEEVLPKITEFTFSAMDKPAVDNEETSERRRNFEDFDNMPEHSTGNIVSIATDSSTKTSTDANDKKKSGLPEINADEFVVANKGHKVSSQMKDNVLNLLDEEEEDEEDDLFVAEDYAMTEFAVEKAAINDANTPKDLCTYLPGWGSWGGPDIKVNDQKKEKFTHKAPNKPKSKFDDKINVLYNEKADMHTNIRNRMVNQLPYPFRSVEDWEASLQGSIGRQFVPELVHRKLIIPAVVTTKGTVIKPMDKSQLVQMPDIQKAVKIKMDKMKDNADNKVYTKPAKLIDVGQKTKKKVTRKSKS